MYRGGVKLPYQWLGSYNLYVEFFIDWKRDGLSIHDETKL